MHINNKGKKNVFDLFKKLVVWQKVAVIAGAVVVVGGVGGGIYALTSINGAVEVDTESTPPVREISSVIESSLVSSDIVSAVSSEGTSSEEASSGTSSTDAASGSSKTTGDTASKGGDTSSKAAPPPAGSTALPEGALEKYADLYKSNKDVKGWIKIPGTKLDYPVVQGKDNYYYLNKNQYKQQDPWGVPYMDIGVVSTKDYQSTGTVIYGHSDDKRGLQFSATKGYRDVEYYKQHPTINFDTLYEEGTYKIVAYFITNQNAANWLQYHTYTEPTSAMPMDKFIEEARKRSYINTTVDVTSTDKLLITQTCQDTNAKNFNRLVMVARKVRPGEEATVDTSGATQNTAQVLPK